MSLTVLAPPHHLVGSTVHYPEPCSWGWLRCIFLWATRVISTPLHVTHGCWLCHTVAHTSLRGTHIVSYAVHFPEPCSFCQLHCTFTSSCWWLCHTSLWVFNFYVSLNFIYFNTSSWTLALPFILSIHIKYFLTLPHLSFTSPIPHIQHWQPFLLGFPQAPSSNSSLGIRLQISVVAIHCLS